MKPWRVRSSGVEQTLAAPASEIPSDAEATFEALYRSSRDDVYAYVAGLLRDRSAAEDVTAAAFERAYRKRSRFDPRRGTPRAWLFGIARNAALDELRRRKRRATLEVDPEDVGATTPEEHADFTLRREVIRAALAQLSGQERDLVSLKFAGGLSNAELGNVLGLSESNAGTRLHRAITKLRKACHEAA
jgi:RNA polymerase sigma-70 factor, ECF subfamily